MQLSVWFLVLALVAEIIGTVGGFGSSVFFVPLANFYFDFQTVLGLTAVFHLASNVSKIALFRKGMDRGLILYIGIPSVAFVIVGGLLTRVLTGAWLEMLLGIFLVGFSLLFLLTRLKVAPHPRPAMVGGAISGFTAGLLGSGGAIRGVTMAAFDLEKSRFIATSAAIDLAIDATRTVVYYQNGFIGATAWIYLPYLFVIGLLGTWLGKWVLRGITQTAFRRIALLLILGIGLVTLVRAWP
ncbi:sulfite exporter TauE/SafE family protein [Lewinella sp. JB7]|uniref:sulfite exporter TauE/SafE family protein n=1 Tax=Lewinella sp. JB7 TaxID=2962887 RepID=UPI0020C9ECC8|nr:sulfite exporter TauE/SafE family protein [Lewinella sp. JB7]MCP9234577.1 sulfite exporter TauE/SafE family protein [Lewinella sp. JB7]